MSDTSRLAVVTAELARPVLADGGIETSLIYDDGVDLPDFAAFVLLADAAGRAALTTYFERYVTIAVRHGVGIVLETPTWRASPDWGRRLGYDADALAAANRAAVALLQDVRRRYERADTPVLVSGCVGPRGDGYVVGETMSDAEAADYHAAQVAAFAEAGADLVTAITMTYPAEAIGVAQAARAAGLPVVLSFTVETDGQLPDGTPLAAAIETVDEATDRYPAYYMVNCAHPTHFADRLEQHAPWTRRIRGLRANASTASHAELDAATELDAGDPADLAERYARLRLDHPQLIVLGGCCGTNEVHVAAIAARCIGVPG